jgi:hypothetical protein
MSWAHAMAEFDADSGADEEERERRGIGTPQERWGCVCPRLDAADCIVFRSAPSWAEYDEQWVEEGERCECHCHSLDDEDREDEP